MAKAPVKKRRKSTRTPKGRKRSSRAVKRGGRGSRRKSTKGRWLLRFIALGFLFSLVAGVYVLYLDHQVRTKFEGKRWAVPARVYGRALELYPGAAVTPVQLTSELKRLGYSKVSHPKQAASWSRNGNRFLVRTRPFSFWDGKEPARYLDFRFKADQLSTIRKVGGGELPLVRLEAPEIGSIYPAHNEDRVLVQRKDLPDLLVKALLAVEDRDFYRHHGVNPKAIARAVWVNMRAGGVVQGGSTLTQQLVKNFYLTRERSLWRKLNEAVMALLLDAYYEKDDILGAYANEIYLGQDGQRAIHGFGLASHFYFNRHLKELDLPKLALLVAMVKGPSYYDPRRHPERALKRRNLVLQLLADQGAITAARAKKASAASLGVTSMEGKGRGSYPAFMGLVRRQLHRDYREEDLNSEGLRIFTTLDPWIQKHAEEAVAGSLKRLENRHKLPAKKLEGAAVVLDSQNGEILGVVGGRKSRYSGFNRALDAVRPVGSLVKPAVYLAALMDSQKYTLISQLDDSRFTVRGGDGKGWSPRNYDRQSHGEVPLHQALAHSYNLSTVRLGLDIGLGEVLDVLAELGISRPIDPVPALLLGAVSLSPLEVAQLYQSFAAGGFHSPLRAIREVQAADGQPLQRYPLTVHQAVPEGPVYLLNRNLQEVVRSGTGKGLSAYLPQRFNIAGKTGTTDKLRDSWFAGFSGDRVAVVWVGRDDNKPAGLTGSSGALQVWGDMMRRMNPQPLELIRPESVELVWIDPQSGLRADEGCSEARQYPFIVGSAPVATSSCVGESGGSLGRIFRSFFE
ncbi:penicillin-binding protein 1B [Solemya velesiana gill symbiont]|uniref:Penicillin-binding protein 1B n=1 Tax=Solemya velesiana gill symbiont TaxID=1918948 RepID=A0A1T2KYB2_9GAMM|nr:penicillin-binding protein 1B [Solemya velesiana gill symbiont]OOZ37750.1 penicillin-binding protein 1B [Solemya velesiana gill symbiont]